MNFERLKYLREDHDLTQIEMANIIDVKQVNISNWENGKEIIPLRKLNMYANYFNVSFDYLLQLTDIKNNTEKVELDKEMVGERIKSIRDKYNLTQRELAKILNTTHSCIGNYENGKTLILTAFAYQICKRYDVSLDWLCCKKSTEKVNS